MTNIVCASWIKLSPKDLIEKSDIILVGEIIGPVGEERYEDSPELWATNWRVKVDYYLKGDKYLSEFIVKTPGADNKPIMTSTDFKLDSWGNTVLLFLYQRDESYEPLTPQGIISLERKKYAGKLDESLEGDSLLKEFSLTDTKISQKEKEELENFISNNKYIQMPLEIFQDVDSRSIQVNSLNILIQFSALFLILALSMLIIKSLLIPKLSKK
ncbi:MAG: hypothetical protein VR72_10720 [Clostridiaceae bacterium BRH_c20a]|nr:MAG: hypothetical protein VR72_10720 [Clostridiaceae bacterium BRH_c20a]